MNLFQAGLVLVAVGWLAASVASPQIAEQPRAGDAARELLARLGAKDFRTREQASAALEQQGDAALPVLRQALAENCDLEIRTRAERLIAVIEARNRSRHSLQRILTHVQQSKEPPSEQQFTHALYLLTLGRPATAEERQDGEMLLKSARQRETALAEWIDRLQKHPDYSKPLAEARLQLQDFRVDMLRDRDAAMGRLLHAARSIEKLPIQHASEAILDAAESLGGRHAIELMCLTGVGRLPAHKECNEIESKLKARKPMVDRRTQLAELWWALMNADDFPLVGRAQP